MARIVLTYDRGTRVIVTQGAIGPQGPPGDGGSGDVYNFGATWTREEDPFPETIGGIVAGSTIADGTNPIEILESLLYPYQVVDFTNFNDNLSTYYELGETAGNQTASFSWSTSGPNGNWVGDTTISSTEEGTIVSGISYDDSPQSYAHPAYRKTAVSAVTFTISSEQSQGADASATTSLLWRHAAYYGRAGVDQNPLVLTDGADLSFATKVHPFTTVNNWQPSVGAVSPSSYVYFIYPSEIYNGVPTVTDITDPNAPIPMPVTDGGTFNYTNDHGITIEYYYIRTTNALGGAIDFKLAT